MYLQTLLLNLLSEKPRNIQFIRSRSRSTGNKFNRWFWHFFSAFSLWFHLLNEENLLFLMYDCYLFIRLMACGKKVFRSLFGSSLFFLFLYYIVVLLFKISGIRFYCRIQMLNVFIFNSLLKVMSLNEWSVYWSDSWLCFSTWWTVTRSHRCPSSPSTWGESPTLWPESSTSSRWDGVQDMLFVVQQAATERRLLQ